MFYKNAGRPLYPGKSFQEFTFTPADSSALPTWLTAMGTSPILTFGTMGNGGDLTMQTKVATPTSGDAAGIQTTSIDPTRYTEIGFFIYGTSNDSAALTDATVNLGFNNGTTEGLYYQHENTNQDTRMRVYPAAATIVRWNLNKDTATGGVIEASRRKDLGFVIRNNGDIFMTAGDPYEGAGVIRYAAGVYPTTSQPITFQIITRTAAQRLIRVNKVKLRLVRA